MAKGIRVAPGGLRASALALTLALLAGCRASSPLEEAGVEVTPPSGWTPTTLKGLAVPGTPLAAWSGPDGASLVVFRALPAPGATAKALAEELANRLTNLPGLRVEVRRVDVVAGREAARVEVVAPGTGGALAPSGTGVPIAPGGKPLVPTRRISLGFPDPASTLWLTWHCPESARGRVAPRVDEALRTLRVRSRPVAGSSY